LPLYSSYVTIGSDIWKVFEKVCPLAGTLVIRFFYPLRGAADPKGAFYCRSLIRKLSAKEHLSRGTGYARVACSEPEYLYPSYSGLVYPDWHTDCRFVPN